jgi:hypothetical protein
MALDIPEREASYIAAIQKLPSASMEKLILALVNAPPTSNPKKMAERITEQVPSVPVERLGGMLDTLYTLYHIRELSGVPYPQFLEDLIEGLRKDRNVQLTERQLKKLSAPLKRLMDIEALKTIAKAARLQRDGERLYCAGKTLSDIRPVFGNDPAARPLGAVLTHTLKIAYHQGSERLEFHVILDSTDLEELAEVIQRAKDKDKALRELLKSTKLPSFDD